MKNKNKKTSMVVRISCMVLAALMILGAAYTALYFLFV